MAELQGELAFMPAADLFRYLGNRGFSGTLTVRSGAEEKRIVLLEGKAVQATSSDPREYVGQFLLHGGRLTEELLEKAFQAKGEANEPLGRLLVGVGVPEAVVREALELKIRETAIELCSWTEGRFVVGRSAARADESGVVVTPLSLAALAAEAQSRARKWREIRDVFPTGSTRVELASTPAAPAPGSVDERIVSLLSEPRSVDELGLFLHATEFQLYSRLLELVRSGAIRIAGRGEPGASPATKAEKPATEPSRPPPRAPRQAARPAPPRADGKPPPPAEKQAPSAVPHLVRARKALQAKALVEAVAAAREAIGIEASSDAVSILRQAESLLLEDLRKRLLATPSKPRSTVDLARLRELPIPPPARYLLTRMNGSRELGSIVRVAPMREIDALEIVERMVQDGWITI
ncbi:MAG TPA: DUF4388 domain-containing protein [Vulgatibacter sp.]|nr:DUF4388 domain-containing protein [Vulgatibacter sp.]